jgi:hypothetical protein
MKVLGIFRAAYYSPGMVERDEAILRAVMARLATAGHTITLVHEEELTADIPMPDMALHMARSFQALQILEDWQNAGCRVINSVESVRGVERATLARWCAMRGISTPKTWIVSTAIPDIRVWETTEGECETITFPCWVKRTGDCAQEPNDVCRVSDTEAYIQYLAQFHARGIDNVVVMEHKEGVCMKFYAVRGTDFFYCLPGYDKWSGVSLPSSSATRNTEYAETIKRSIVHQIEKIEYLPIIYGGDAIIDSDGTAYLIDLNDWPSFSSCREEAADAISRLVIGG